MSLFPRKSQYEDEARHQFLELMCVPDFPGVYVLGCFARYVTVYSQQIRALNLVDCLAKSGMLTAESRIAVVGAGIAGLTAAAAAATRGVREVQVFERLENTMRIQRTTHVRFIHPHIYDWPREKDGDWARIPIMDWHADDAGRVIEQFDKELIRLRMGIDDSPFKLPRFDCRQIGIEMGDAGVPIITSNGSRSAYDVVILAIGFGPDRDENTPGYWSDTTWDSLESESRHDAQWLISGAGDGALTDLMRLCILDFNHGHVLATFQDPRLKYIGEALVQAESDYQLSDRGPGAREKLQDAYKFAAEQAETLLDQSRRFQKRNVGFVHLNVSEADLFLPKSSLLNRLITAYLLKQKRFDIVPGSIEKPISGKKDADGFLEVKLKQADGTTPGHKFHHVILRHGPVTRPIPEFFPNIEAKSAALKEKWDSTTQHEDWTRIPLFSNDDFKFSNPISPPMRIVFPLRYGCVLVAPNKSLSQAIKRGVESFRTRKLESVTGAMTPAGASRANFVEILTVEDIFEFPYSYERAVRAICEAEMAIFDLSGYDPAVMLMLGIRAASRRGVTITVQSEDQVSQQLPFNISMLNPVPIRSHGSFLDVADALDRGCSAYARAPETYLDLPVFEAVRWLTDPPEPIPPDQKVLKLQWFETKYRAHAADPIEHSIKLKFPATSIETLLDSRDPRLVEKRLYSAIRRTTLCIVDWTGWRPNVFFEMGVRIAVNRFDPIIILCNNCPEKLRDARHKKIEKGNSVKLLREFFNPIEFNQTEGGDAAFRQRLDVDPATFEVPKVFSWRISPGCTYRLVAEMLHRPDEPGGKSIVEFLKRQAERIADTFAPEEGSSPVLYPEKLKDVSLEWAFTAVVAAWYYLVGRHKLWYDVNNKFTDFTTRLKELTETDLQTLDEVAIDVEGRLLNVPRTENVNRFRRELQSQLKAYKEARNSNGRGGR